MEGAFVDENGQVGIGPHPSMTYKKNVFHGLGHKTAGEAAATWKVSRTY